MRCLLFLLTLCCSVAYSQAVPNPCPGHQVCLSWTPPTQNTDGTTLTNLAGYRIVYGTSVSAMTQIVQVPNPSVSSYKIDALAPATYHFAVRAYTTAGLESVNSNSASKVITSLPGVPPAPPVLTVASTEVFQVIGTADQFQFLPVGTVPPTTKCIAAQTVNGRYAVPAAAVTWYGNVKPKIVVAICNG
jgi:hypothetical protein